MIRVMRARWSGEDFSTDGCKTQSDVNARREFLKYASQHQTRAHKFGYDDARALGLVSWRANVRWFRINRVSDTKPCSA